MIKNWIIFALFMGFCWTSAWAQQEWGYGQFAMNLFDCNVAYAGQHETPSLGLRHRQQWTGIDGGPKSSHFSFHMPFAQNKMGLGLRILTESIGARQQTAISGAWAYRLRLRGSTLNFALAGGVSRNGINWSKVNVLDLEDAQIGQWQNAKWAPLLNAAVFYSRKNAYAGIEVSQITRSHYDEILFEQKAHLKAVVGYHQKVRKDDQLQVAALYKWSEGGEWQAECNILYLKNNKVGLGAGYRMNYGAIVLAQFYFNDKLRLGLNYDLSTQSTQQIYDGSFELFIGYTMDKGEKKSIRYL